MGKQATETKPAPGRKRKASCGRSTTEVNHAASKKTNDSSLETDASGVKSSAKRTYSKKVEDIQNKFLTSQKGNEQTEFSTSLPTRNKHGKLVFDDWSDFRPNLTPKEVLQAGSFGGTYFRPIKSGITGEMYGSKVWKELPADWLEGLNIPKQVASSNYDENVNTYKVKCGGSLQMWEESGWIHKQDPYGWFQWYCRFYQGRRTGDDERQIGRWLRCAGPRGRWRNNLISKCVKSGSTYSDKSVSPVVRQTLQHWAYKLTEPDFETQAKQLRKKGLG